MRELLARVASDLRSLKARHAIVGGHAVSARTEPRFTRDLDFAVAVADDRQAEQLAGSMAARGYRIVAFIEQAGGSEDEARLVLRGIAGTGAHAVAGVGSRHLERLAVAPRAGQHCSRRPR